MSRLLRGLAVASAVVAAALACVLVTSSPASAHSVLVSSTPRAGETLSELPAEFSVTMNETLLGGAGDAAFALRVRGADGLYYGDGCLTLVDATLSTPAAIGPAGDYTLEWQVVSADGHPVSGDVPFRWTGAAGGPGSSAPPSCGGASAPASDASADREVAFPLGDALWIGGAVVAVVAAVTVALLATRRRGGH